MRAELVEVPSNMRNNVSEIHVCIFIKTSPGSPRSVEGTPTSPRIQGVAPGY